MDGMISTLTYGPHFKVDMSLIIKQQLSTAYEQS